jgi:hypothetical protein
MTESKPTDAMPSAKAGGEAPVRLSVDPVRLEDCVKRIYHNAANLVKKNQPAP